MKPHFDAVRSLLRSKRKTLRGVRYEMMGFLEQCVEAYVSLAKVKIESLKKVFTPSLDEHSFTEKERADKGELAPIAAKVLVNILYAARMFRFDLLFAVCSLACEIRVGQ